MTWSAGVPPEDSGRRAVGVAAAAEEHVGALRNVRAAADAGRIVSDEGPSGPGVSALSKLSVWHALGVGLAASDAFSDRSR